MIYQSMFNPLPDEDVYTKEEIDEALKNKIEAPMATPELGWFAGMGDAIGHGVVSGGLKTASNAEEVLAGTVRSALSQYENETGEELPSLPGQEEQSIEEREQAIVEQIEAEAKELRRVAREEYGINEQTMGAASQVVFGLTEGLTKAIGYTMMMGPGLGAYAYGADYGMSTFHEARDEGVDFGTALTMGGVGAVSGALGLRVPATFGRSRTQSAVLGALVNMGFTGAEAETISFILDKQGYSKLAQRHQADITSLIVSGLFGGVMGGALYRAKPKLGEADQRIEGEQAYQTPEEKYREQLKDTGLYSTEQAEGLASIHGLANRNLAKLAGLSEEDAVLFTAEVDFVDDVGGRGFNQAIDGDTKLKTEVESWNKTVDDMEKKPNQPIVMLTQTPLVMNLVGAKFRELRVHPHVFDGIVQWAEKSSNAHHSHPDMSKNVLKQLPAALTDPIAIFDDERNRSKIFMLELKDDAGETVIAPVAFSAQGYNGEINLVKTAFGKSGKLWFDLQVQNETILYVNREKIKRWNPTSGTNPLLDSTASNKSVLTENDLVKLKQDNPSFYQTAYHGTPHIFNKFNLQAIGTGEGAQAHGWGLYFAKNREVAEGYRNALAGSEITYKGKDINQLYRKLEDSGQYGKLAIIEQFMVDQSLPTLRKDAQNYIDDGAFSKEEWDWFEKEVAPYVKQEGRVFEVDIPQNSKFIKEASTFAEQSKTVQKGIIKVLDELKEQGKDVESARKNILEWNQGYIYNIISSVAGGDKEASLLLNKYGIKGLSYDGGRDGDAFVVFDDEAIKVLDFYQRSQNVNPVATITGEEFGSSDIDIKELRANAKNWYDQNLRGKAVVNKQTGKEIVFANSNKAIATSANPEKLKAFAALESVLRDGNMREMEGIKKPKGANILGYYWVTANVDIGGKIVEVGATVRQQTDGRFYYNHNVLKDETPNSTPTLRHNAGGEVEGSEKLRQSNPLTSDDTFNIYIGQENQTIKGSYNPKTNKIKLTPNADLSTFSHEMSHFYLDKMIDLSTNYSSVDYQVKTDMDNLLKYYGVKDGLKGWDSLDFEQQRKVQEQFASHSEIFLSTGKAPSRTLKKAFERLGLWILSVYRYLGGVEHGVSERYKAEFGEDLPSLSPEVKKVLDRLYSDIETKAKEEVKNARVDNETVAAARVLLTKIATNKKLMAILRKAKDRNAPLTKEEEEYATNMLRSLEIANNQINASQAVSVAQNFSDAPVDLDLIRKHSDQFVKTYNSGDVVLQNRDRSSKSSIAQMKSIASNPDYGRLGYSTSLANGAPVIGYADSIPAEQLGKESFMVDSEGKRYPTQYAVVDADSVLTSNAIDGTHNASYYEDNGAMKAIAGNGRITALNEAYRLGTIGKYLEEFKNDALHGVHKAVIEKLKKPILVRIMRNEDITADIGDISNRSDSQQLSDVEQAMTDAQRVNLDELRYTEDGDITADSVAQFLSALPAEERARMIDSSGMPKKSAYARLERAIFQAAYGSPSATELLDSVEKTGVSRLLSAYRQLGTSLMGLAGELDFRPSMLDVLSEIRNAKLSGNLPSIQELASQVNITRSPEADAILRFLAKNEETKGGVQGIINTFKELADFAKANMDSASQGVDLFGEVVNPTRLDLMRKFSEITGVEIDEVAIQKAMDEAKQIAEAAQRATDDVIAKVEETQMIDETPVTQKDVESSAGLFEEAQALEAERAQAMKVLTNSEETMVQNLAIERPDAVYKVKDAEGNDVTLTAQEILEMNQKNLEQAKIEQSALGRAVECVINNNGLGV